MKITQLTAAQKTEIATLKAAVDKARTAFAEAQKACNAYLDSVGGTVKVPARHSVSDDGNALITG